MLDLFLFSNDKIDRDIHKILGKCRRCGYTTSRVISFCSADLQPTSAVDDCNTERSDQYFNLSTHLEEVRGVRINY